jgi:hypothetical protein
MPRDVRPLGWLLAGLLAALPAAAADDGELARDDRIAELERKVEILTDELERTRAEVAVPEQPELKSQYGLGPAASRIYGITRGLSIGGYGEGTYQALVGDKGSGTNRADWLRMVLYAGYKFTENIVFNTEIEFEHATTSSTVSSSGGSVAVEFATLDFFWRDAANARAGLLLLPMGFLNQVHEPPFYFGVNRPEVERQIIPSTWRENGAGLFGTFFGESLQYEMYAVNGFNAAGFSPSGLRGGRQSGNRALAEDLAFVGRLDWSSLPGLLLGGSVYLGDSGQDQTLTTAMGSAALPDTFTALWELHADYEWRDAHFRTLFTMANLQDAGELSAALRTLGSLPATAAVASDMLGVYVEVAYDVWKLFFPESRKSFEPFFRFEWLDTQQDMPAGFSADESQRLAIYTAGFSFEPIPNVVIKSDYRNLDPQAGQRADELNLGVGFAF